MIQPNSRNHGVCECRRREESSHSNMLYALFYVSLAPGRFKWKNHPCDLVSPHMCSPRQTEKVDSLFVPLTVQ